MSKSFLPDGNAWPGTEPDTVEYWQGHVVYPISFPYLEAILAGRPVHKNDSFAARHPQMSPGRRAKIFAPFDALEGFMDSIHSREQDDIRQ